MSSKKVQSAQHESSESDHSTKHPIHVHDASGKTPAHAGRVIPMELVKEGIEEVKREQQLAFAVLNSSASS